MRSINCGVQHEGKFTFFHYHSHSPFRTLGVPFHGNHFTITKIYAQDDVEDVEEFFGDDDEDEYYDDEDEYLDDDEYEDDEYYDDEDEYEDDEEFEDDEDYEEELSDEAENLGYTIDLAMGSPRFTNPY